MSHFFLLFREWDKPTNHNHNFSFHFVRKILTQFFQEIPAELDEAAYLDGANRLTVYLRVILPLATPVLTTLAIFTFLGTWNEYLWPLVSATDRQSLTMTIGLRKLAETFGLARFASARVVVED